MNTFFLIKTAIFIFKKSWIEKILKMKFSKMFRKQIIVQMKEKNIKTLEIKNSKVKKIYPKTKKLKT